ncbi:MAG: hypothetical protein HOG85_04590 [Flavobacteriales bacterium]|nr:hypothetical protein [Flavobacteriales bacterium]
MKKLILIFFVFSGILVFSQEKEDYFNIKISDNNIRNCKVDKDGYFQIKISDMESFLESYIIYYENNGYPFVEVKLDNITGNKANLVVNKGELYTIDSLAIYGNTRLTEKQLFQLIGIKKGETYNQKKLDEINNKLTEITYLKQKRKYDFVFHKNTADIYFYLEKESTNFIDGLIGINTIDKEISLNGFVNINLQNLLNKGENIKLEWRSEQEKFQKISTHFSYPFIFNSKIGTEINLNILRQFNSFTNIEKQVRFNYNLNSKKIIKIQYYNLSSVTEGENTSFNNISENSVGFGFIFRNKNILLNGNSYFGKRNIENKKLNSVKLNLNSAYFIPLKNNFAGILRTTSSIILSEDLYINELLQFGGSNSLKGFNENEFFADRFSVGTAEIKYNLEKNTSFSVFFQQAYFQKKTINEVKISDWPMSIGFGTNLESKTGTIYIQYAIGKTENTNFNLRNGKIHIGIQNTF